MQNRYSWFGCVRISSYSVGCENDQGKNITNHKHSHCNTHWFLNSVLVVTA